MLPSDWLERSVVAWGSRRLASSALRFRDPVMTQVV